MTSASFANSAGCIDGSGPICSQRADPFISIGRSGPMGGRSTTTSSTRAMNSAGIDTSLSQRKSSRIMITITTMPSTPQKACGPTTANALSKVSRDDTPELE